MKYGILRYVQTALSIELFELFRRRQLAVDTYLDLNQSVEERIRYALRKNWVATERDIIITCIMYIKSMDINNMIKIRHYTDGKTVFPVENGSLREIHDDIISIFEDRLLID